MAYLFGTGQTDMLSTTTGVVSGSTWSIAVRLAFTTSTDAESRVLAAIRTGTHLNAQIWGQAAPGSGHNERINLLVTTNNGTSFEGAIWDSEGFTAGSVHALVGTCDGTTLRIYADDDTTAKASLVLVGTLDVPSGVTYSIGNDAGTNSAHGTIYETAWWPGTVLTGEQARSFGLGYDAQFTRPKPTNHFRLINNALDHTNNTGANFTGSPSVVAHNARVFYPAQQSVVAPRAAFVPSGDTAMRRSSSSLGTRTGSRQAVEV